MLDVMTDLPDHVLGVRASGEVSQVDYTETLVPALEEKLTRFRKARLLYVAGETFEGYSGGAAWEDAKIGMKHLTAFERVALVSDIDWITGAVRAFGFVFPGEVRVFDDDQLEDARAWICEPPSEGDLEFTFMKDERVLILEPRGELEAADFARVSEAIDPTIAETGALNGLVVVAEHFPGWDDLAALSSHVRFVRAHHSAVKRVALVTEDRVLSALPRVATHFVDAEVRRFPMSERDAALTWAAQG
ncbi:MAG: STAS/SEC14 domain-containing protein [Pseudomonadota bacterium]